MFSSVLKPVSGVLSILCRSITDVERHVQNVAEVTGRLEGAYPGASSIQVVDITPQGDEANGTYVAVNLVDEGFAGVPLLRRHREVGKLFGDLLSSNTVHAFSADVWTDEEWAKVQGSRL
ncbi:BolA protein [Kipferlia bialata]|uniref:BolA protein n=1 Tax=Kipferlia bialata TaxID=797122 RepID=A0A9K3D0N6_9EUKA|nr:BolA protein [Kipferlia bialata]|eukprot:g7677.t1